MSKKQVVYFKMRSWWNNDGDFIERSHIHELGADKDTFSAAVNDCGSGIYWVAGDFNGCVDVQRVYFFLDKSCYIVGGYEYHSLVELERYLESRYYGCFFLGYFVD